MCRDTKTKKNNYSYGETEVLEITNIEVFGLERSIRASGNPMTVGTINTTEGYDMHNAQKFDKDNRRAKSLGSAETGSGHDNFLSGIDVYFDVKYPLYWSPEFQRYHFNQIISSQSTMHKLTTMASDENFDKMFNKYVDPRSIAIVKELIQYYNYLEFMELNDDGVTYSNDCLDKYTKKELEQAKYEAFMRLRSSLPSGFELWMTVKSNYLSLKTMYNQRKSHKLFEDWQLGFIKMCNELPRFLELTGLDK